MEVFWITKNKRKQKHEVNSLHSPKWPFAQVMLVFQRAEDQAGKQMTWVFPGPPQA